MNMPTIIDGEAAIRSSLVKAWELDSYTQIQREAREVNVSSNAAFQQLFNHFYRIRRNAKWQEAYYEIMQREKINAELSFDSILREMFERIGSVESSFTSKMIATLDPSKPIWDSIVLERLGLKLRGTTSQTRLENAADVYERIIAWYEAYLATDDAKKNIRLFDEFLPRYSWITPTKKIDFLLWGSR